MVELPDGIARRFANRGYYGSVNHNVKAVYNFYLGWFDGNPANLHPLPPVAEGRKFVEYAGGADALLARAHADFEAGEYRWVAHAVNHLVFAQPDNTEATTLLADTYEQLAYQAESGPWRNFYLAGATELRQGIRAVTTPSAAQPGLVASMSVEAILDALAVRLNGPSVAEVRGTIAFEVDDSRHLLELSNGTLHHHRSDDDPADTVVRMPRSALDAVVMGRDIGGLVADGTIGISGDPTVLHALVTNLDSFEFWFPIVTP
jgi:alkyl sulfatase BDS1-like metallo-beta-lactamase superfamily hydrolase